MTAAKSAPQQAPTGTKPRVESQARRSRGRPRTEDLAALEARILLVARQSFVRHGYGAASINEIARAAQISKNTFYARFASKAALFRAIVEQQVANLESDLQPATRVPGETLEEHLRTYANVALEASLGGDILHINRLIYSESGRFPELGEAAAARNRVGVRHIANLIKQSTALNGASCREPERAAELFIMMLNGWYSAAMVGNRTVTTAERRAYVDGAIRMFMAALPSL